MSVDEWRKAEEKHAKEGILFDLMRDVSDLSKEEIDKLRVELSNQIEADVAQVIGDAKVAYDLPVYVSVSYNEVEKRWGLTVEVVKVQPFLKEDSAKTFLRVCRRVRV